MNPPSIASGAQEKLDFEDRPLSRRIVDAVFGYDFFISYKWEDGRPYAYALAEKLMKQGFQVFLDSKDYGTGDDWQKIGAWTLQRTGQLILVASELALRPRDTETPVEREVRLFARTGRRIIPIAFVPRGLDGGFNHSASTIELARPTSTVLRYIPAQMLAIKEDASLFKTGPSEAALKEIAKTFTLVRQDKKRARIFGIISMALVGLTLTAAGLAIWAEISRRKVSDQLAKQLYASGAATENLLEAFLYTAKAVEASTASNNKLHIYLDRLMQLSTRLPGQVINLPVMEGVDSAEFNPSLDRVILVTDNRKVRVFELPEAKELFVPDFVNRRGIASGTQPVFDNDGTTVRAWLYWFHPEPDPDEPRPYVLGADWNVKTGQILSPIDNGIISWEDLKWTVVSKTLSEAEGLKYPVVISQRFDSSAFFQLQPSLTGKALPVQGGKVSGASAAAVLANGTIALWPEEPRIPLVTVTSMVDGGAWQFAAFSHSHLVALSKAGDLAVWRMESGEKAWTKPTSSTAGEFQISPDETLVVVADTAYDVAQGTPKGAVNAPEGYDELMGQALTDEASQVWLGRSFSGNSDDLSFVVEAFSKDSGRSEEGKSYDIESKPADFIDFLANGNYHMAGTAGSFQVRDIRDGIVASFYFGSTSNLTPELAQLLIRQVVEIETLNEGKATLVLRGGALVQVQTGATINKDLRLALDGMPVVNPRSNDKGWLHQAILSPDGRWLATKQKESVQVWDSRTGYPLTGSIPLVGEVLDFAFSNDSKRLLIATDKGTVITAIVSFAWNGKPSWLEGLAEGLTGMTLAENGDPQLLSLQELNARRAKLQAAIESASPADKAAALLRARFTSFTTP